MLSFRVDHATAEHLRKYARIRHTTVSEVLRNWSENCDMKIFLPPRAKDKLAIIARGKKNPDPRTFNRISHSQVLSHFAMV